MFRIAIVDDEAATLAFLRDGTQAALKEAGLSAEIKVFPSAEDFLAHMADSFQLILLDIQMSGMNGMECAERIRLKDQQAIIIFITSMVQYAVQGYKVNALDYIVKPVDSVQLKMSLNRAFKRLEAFRPKVISFRTPGGMTAVSVSEILFVEAVNHSAVARTTHGDIPCGMTLSAVESKLQPYGFFRCHAGFLVNLAFVEQVTATDAITGGRCVPVSKHRRRELMQAITAWWGKNI